MWVAAIGAQNRHVCWLVRPPPGTAELSHAGAPRAGLRVPPWPHSAPGLRGATGTTWTLVSSSRGSVCTSGAAGQHS